MSPRFTLIKRTRELGLCRFAGRCRASRYRPGAAAVELAAVLPVLVLMLLGSLELGRAIMVRHVLEEAARAG